MWQGWQLRVGSERGVLVMKDPKSNIYFENCSGSSRYSLGRELKERVFSPRISSGQARD